jgi:hypothetical protein
MTSFVDQITQVGPAQKNGAIDGSKPVHTVPDAEAEEATKADQPAPRRRGRRATATGPAAPVYEGKKCPRCGNEYPEADFPRHLIAELRGLEEQVTEMQRQAETFGPEGVRSELDDLGHPLIYGPDDELRPIVFLRPDEIIVDSNVQRGIEKRHFLLRKGVTFNPNKSEAFTVVPVYDAAGEGDGDAPFKLVGYRAMEGQHRTLLALQQVPGLAHPCKIVPIETQAEESRTALEMQGSRLSFRWVEKWGALLRMEQPNVVAGARLLQNKGYRITGNPGRGNISAAKAILTIVGVSDEMHVDRVTKDPAEGTRDLEWVLRAVDAMPGPASGDDFGRYSSKMLGQVYSLIARNRDSFEIDRLVSVVAPVRLEEWLEFGNPRYRGSTKILRRELVTAYNRGLGERRRIQ